MKYFLDTEFLENGKTIELISIGIINEKGDTFYRQNKDFNWDTASQWLIDNVKSSLIDDSIYNCSRQQIANDLMAFLGNDDNIEFWGYFADYDWVLVCQLFGRMIDLPKPLPMFCMDLMQLQKMHGVRIKQKNSRHNALDDARWIKETYEKLMII